MLDREDLPLDGTVVLDFSQFLAGPVAALRLADLGARVIKVERPVTGEIGRTLAFAGRWIDGDTASFHAMNRNKEAVVADLKDPADLALVKDLVRRADVLLHNFRPGVMERLGLDHPTVAQLNPGLVYASASGYGADGPWAGRPGQDLLAQSVSALPWVSGSGTARSRWASRSPTTCSAATSRRGSSRSWSAGPGPGAAGWSRPACWRACSTSSSYA